MHCDRFALLSNLFFSEIVGKKKYLLYQLILKEQKMAIILLLGFLTSQDSVKENILKINYYFHMFLTIFVVYIILNSVNSWWIKPSLFLQSGFKFEWPQTVRKTMHPQKLLRNAPFFWAAQIAQFSKMSLIDQMYIKLGYVLSYVLCIRKMEQINIFLIFHL